VKVRAAARLTLATLGVALISGAASAFFLVTLEAVTAWRESHPWALQLLPLAGLVSVWMYRRWGPAHPGPLILSTTLLTHAFGGSAGREGTAVQMGGAAADRMGHWSGLTEEQRRHLALAGMSAGFASVFGTPWAGTVFGVEVMTVGSFHWRNLRTREFWNEISGTLPLCALAAFGADAVALPMAARFGFHHATYPVGSLPTWTLPTLLLVAAASLAFALAARVFVAAMHGLATAYARVSPHPYARVALGGVLVTFAGWLAGEAYVGLGTGPILAAFDSPAWLGAPVAKTLTTALTLGCGFKGGEVTPLFFVGSTLGSALSLYVPLSTGVLAALGLAAVFAGAANVPWAAVVLAMELFGFRIAPGALLACLVAYSLSSHRGIYAFQVIAHRKWRPFNPRR
jgi:H+/Cl- antiporter ClcA